MRLAGVDAPETAHFGREAQPYADVAQKELRKLVEGRTVWLDMALIDQYQRLVATPSCTDGRTYGQQMYRWRSSAKGLRPCIVVPMPRTARLRGSHTFSYAPRQGALRSNEPRNMRSDVGWVCGA